ncbi:hypothetical protein HYDPIDRAFT_34361 [Hydnomerulius pinastri MD-312]|uniref:Uncharacterized protein n=1 Tax=Hydnomerulius pinastri MD-312 TaxID=994086 RepID=A0A0C9W6C3_9AGAM|nr:hypothetical protein HYDPIDRAFT_34361 [Hydnomerulius pinastri MD-312]
MEFESWIDASRAAVDEPEWLLVAEPIRLNRAQHDSYEYYYVVPIDCTVAWHTAFDGSYLFQECTVLRRWPHKRQEFEAQFWKHIEYFPDGVSLLHSEMRSLRAYLNWTLLKSLTINGTMAVTIFGNIDRLQMVMQILAYADELWTSEYNSNPSTVALIGTFPSCVRANGKLITRHRTRDAYDLSPPVPPSAGTP